jgi:hypothetical protein
LNIYSCRVFCRRGWTPNMLMAVSRLRDGSTRIDYDGETAERAVWDVLYGNRPPNNAPRSIQYRGTDVTLDVEAQSAEQAKDYILRALAGLTRHPDANGCKLVAVQIETTRIE